MKLRNTAAVLPPTSLPKKVQLPRLTDAHLLDQGGIVQTALLQIADRFRMAVELELIEGSRLLQAAGKRERV